jgi:hypothetical protein
MIDYLALLCPKILSEVRQIFLEKIMKRLALKLSHNLPNNNNKAATKKKQKKIMLMFKSSKLKKAKITRCNYTFIRLFVYCSLLFRVVSNLFFIDFVKSLCPVYEFLNHIILVRP